MPHPGLKALEDAVSLALRGKQKAVRHSIICLLARGHLLIEDVPGVGKTTLALALSKVVDCSFKRIQFTSDLLPSDITGVNVFNTKTGEFEFRPGPIFANIVLADEINRSSPKTQSALLEAMNENCVSVDGNTFMLPDPFMVIATQNPLEQHGTYPLPESQLDRFMISIRIGYPSPEVEKDVLKNITEPQKLLESVPRVLGVEELLSFQKKCTRLKVDDSIIHYIHSIVLASRGHDMITLGASTRSAQFLLRAAMASAFYSGRDFVAPEDVKEMAPVVLAHRLVLKNGGPGQANPVHLIKDIVNGIAAPV